MASAANPGSAAPDADYEEPELALFALAEAEEELRFAETQVHNLVERSSLLETEITEHANQIKEIEDAITRIKFEIASHLSSARMSGRETDYEKVGIAYYQLYCYTKDSDQIVAGLGYLYQALKQERKESERIIRSLGLDPDQIKRERRVAIRFGERAYSSYNQGLEVAVLPADVEPRSATIFAPTISDDSEVSLSKLKRQLQELASNLKENQRALALAQDRLREAQIRKEQIDKRAKALGVDPDADNESTYSDVSIYRESPTP